MNQSVMVGGRRPLVEDDLQWKMTSVGRRPLVEDNLWWKTTFSGRLLLVEDTFSGRRPLVEDELRWKMTFGGRCLLVEDDPCMLSSPLCCIFCKGIFVFPLLICVLAPKNWSFDRKFLGFICPLIIILLELLSPHPPHNTM